MKLLLPLTVLAAVGVSAQDESCAANYIVTQCLATESGKPANCAPTDYDCMCSAYQAVATCYNNCPNDPRAFAARNQEASYCQNASLYGTKAAAAKTSSTAASPSASEAPATTSESAAIKATGTHSSGTASAGTASAGTASAGTASAGTASAGTASASASKSTSSGAADALAGSAGGALMAAVGIVAALV